ncbi:DUF5819 family protein [Streptomyces sp. NBC_01102]|uniref:DUF5819 family protein n=1 Tax=Streptomyces sp. NBC_01102 TaxID=2903749 RepID=UPI00386E74F6|nr:DUF5819 family protein [Streptomyces sp. NBC_01102]
MDSDHGGRAGNEKKVAWPEVTSHPAAGQDAGQGAAAPATDGGDNRADADAAPPGIPDAGPDGDGLPDGPSAPDNGPAGRRTGAGIAALSLPYQITAALALSVIGLLACGHLAMVFLHVAPSNTLTKQHGEVVDDWIYPEFEQNWKLFAPNPLQQNIYVHVRAEVAGADGRTTTRWMSLTHEDGEAIRGNPLPSHVHQNELRRAWDFYTGSHTGENRPNGLRGELSERYIRRIVMMRLSEHDYGGTVERIQVRSAVRSVGAPPWSDEKISTKPTYRVLPWWTVTPADLPAKAGEDQASQGEEAEK